MEIKLTVGPFEFSPAQHGGPGVHLTVGGTYVGLVEKAGGRGMILTVTDDIENHINTALRLSEFAEAMVVAQALPAPVPVPLATDEDQPF